MLPRFKTFCIADSPTVIARGFLITLDKLNLFEDFPFTSADRLVELYVAKTNVKKAA